MLYSMTVIFIAMPGLSMWWPVWSSFLVTIDLSMVTKVDKEWWSMGDQKHTTVQLPNDSHEHITINCIVSIYCFGGTLKIIVHYLSALSFNVCLGWFMYILLLFFKCPFS